MISIIEARAGLQAPNQVSATQIGPLGQICDARNDALTPTAPEQGIELIYLKATGAGIVVGSMVDYDTLLGTAVLSPATAGVGSVAVSLNIVAAGSFAWFVISGEVAVKAPNAMVVGADVFSLAATPGSVDDAVVNGEQVLNAKVSTTTGTPGTGLGIILINRPFHQGAIL